MVLDEQLVAGITNGNLMVLVIAFSVAMGTIGIIVKRIKIITKKSTEDEDKFIKSQGMK